MSLKLVFAALLLFAVVIAGFGQTLTKVDASVTGPLVASAPSIISGATPITITVPVGAPNANEDVSVSLSTASGTLTSGTLRVVACTPECPVDLNKTASVGGPALVVVTDGLSQILLSLALTCSENAVATVVADTASDPARSININCNAAAAGGGGGGQLVGGGQVVATASPNLLPCEGGTSVIKAEVVAQDGTLLVGATFRFETTAGLLVQTSPSTATLTLGPNQTSAVVTAKIDDPVDETVKTATVNVSLACNNPGGQTVVVTASPNVIECTGTTTITATVRDGNGHVVVGKGFHFVTNAGLLEVFPNNASTTEGRAILTLRPGDGDATVIVLSGELHGTYQELDVIEAHYGEGEDRRDTGFVTVQQRCLSTPTGMIKVNASSQNIACGETVFIGLSVVDVNIQTVENNTPISLIATYGGFYAGPGAEPLKAAQVPTTRGQANTIYIAPDNFHGTVKITAASGAVYGFQNLNVHCVTAPATGTGTGSAPAPGPAPCVPIGDGVCITPPNTGNRITPPNTGTAGIR